MKKLFSILFIFCAMQMHASTVIFSWTNWLAFSVFTNNLKITPVGNAAEFDGTWLIAGRAIQLQSTNGFYTNTFNLGNYKVEVLPNPGFPRADVARLQPIIFAVPDDTNTYQVGQLLISGYNQYNYTPGVLQLTSSNGSVTLSQTNGRGIIDLSVAGGGSGFSGVALTNFAGTLSTNSTNFGGILSTNATNFVGIMSTNATNWTIAEAQGASNYAGVLSTNATNSIVSTSNILEESDVALTNWIGIMSTNATNFSGILSTNATNWSGVLSTNATNAIVSTSNILYSYIGGGGFSGIALTNWVGILSTNATNFAGILSTNATNWTISQAQGASNYAGVLSTNATNYAQNTVLVEAYSFTEATGTSETNYMGILSTNATNWSGVISTNATNFAGILSTNATNWAGMLSTNSTNFAGILSTNSTNFAKLVGTTISNYAQSGNLVLSNIAGATGTASSSTYLRGDYSWATPSGSGGGGPTLAGNFITNAAGGTVLTNGPLGGSVNPLTNFQTVNLSETAGLSAAAVAVTNGILTAGAISNSVSHGITQAWSSNHYTWTTNMFFTGTGSSTIYCGTNYTFFSTNSGVVQLSITQTGSDTGGDYMAVHYGCALYGALGNVPTIPSNGEWVQAAPVGFSTFYPIAISSGSSYGWCLKFTTTGTTPANVTISIDVILTGTNTVIPSGL